jgi:hypothetical protein
LTENTIIAKILRLDKQVYNEIITYPSSLQKGIAIWTTATILITLSAVRFFTGIIDYLEVNLYFFGEEASSEELLMLQTLIDELQVEFQQSTFTSLFSSLVGSVSASVVGVLIVFVVLKYLLRKEPQPKDLAVIYLYSSIPGLLTIPAIFVSSLFVQGLLLFITAIYSFATLGSGLKQVYFLRNIEVILLLVSITFGSTILSYT